MKTIKLNVLKKNRKYFKCEYNSRACRLKIDKNSENLELGQCEMLMNDISVRSKYGIDVIYELAVDAEKQKSSAGVVTLKADYNAHLVKKCRNLGGRWCCDTKSWVFLTLVGQEVEELDVIYNSDKIVVEITASHDCYAHLSDLTFKGITIATATSRDSGAQLGNGIALLRGKIRSGGSNANWNSQADDDSVFRLEIPEKVFEMKVFEINEKDYDERNWKKIEVVKDCG
tara:strand:- start:6552 stop:7238 length:687 start_codon:yes stop_codon:yes gene_type:complete